MKINKNIFSSKILNKNTKKILHYEVVLWFIKKNITMHIYQLCIYTRYLGDLFIKTY